MSDDLKTVLDCRTLDSKRREHDAIQAFHAMQSRACRSERFGPGWSE